MKYIINGGISTTTIPSYTRDAILLAIQDESLAGVALNIFLTSDNEVVAYQTDTVDHGKEKISDLTLYNLQRRNFGESVRNHPILKLKEALDIFEKTSKMLILSLNIKECPISFLKKVLEITKNYPNIDIYIKTANKETINYLQNSCRRQRVGVIIEETNQEMWDEDLDFFSINEPSCNYERIKEKINANKRIMLENLNTQERFEHAYNELKDIPDNIYVITDTSTSLANIIIATCNGA